MSKLGKITLVGVRFKGCQYLFLTFPYLQADRKAKAKSAFFQLTLQHAKNSRARGGHDISSPFTLKSWETEGS